MKHVLFILGLFVGLILCLTMPAHAQTNCATSSLSVGWHDCGPTTPLIIGCGYSCGGSVDPAGGSAIYSFSGGIWDPIRSRHIAFGGGHNDSGDNSQYAVTIPVNGNTPTSTKISAYPGNTGCSNSFTLPSVPSCDGGITPNSRHTYGQLVYYPPLDAMFVNSGALSNVGNSAGDMWFYYFSGAKAGTWEYLNPNITCIDSSNRNPCQYVYQGQNFTFNPNLPSDNATAGEDGTVAYDPTTQLIWIMDAGGGNLWNYNPATRVLKQTAGYNLLYFATGDGHSFGVIDPSRHKFWLIANSMLGFVDITSNATANTFQLVSPQPFTSSGVSNGIAYDPVTTHIVMWHAGNDIVDYNPTTNVATTTTYSGGPPRPGLADFEGNVYGHFAYAPAPIDAFVVNNGANLNEFVFRNRSNGTPDTTPPSTPASLTATAISASQINLAWTASTDNVAVGGYFVERCSGGGCSNFTQIASAPSNSYADSGLTASTSYSYRVRAFDTSSNLSGYSNTATATTQAPDTTPPTAPSSLTATGLSSSQINLAWTASTDAVGVTRYRVERCSGVSCSSFAEIAQINGTPPAVVYSDFNLSGSTSYSYRVRANDIAGNLSSYSNTASDTTQAAPSTVTLVDFGSITAPPGGSTTSDATFGLTGWTTAFKDAYTTEIACAGCSNGGGMTNFYTSTGVYNSAGVRNPTGTRSFVPGEVITATWFNSSAGSIAFTPKVSFNTTGRIIDGGTWYVMSTVTVAAAAFATTTYTIDATSVGTYSIVNVSAIYDPNQQALVLDKIVLQPSGSTDTTPPTNPSSLVATSISQSEIDLNWTGSTDVGGVTSYLIERCAGAACSNFAQVATVNGVPPITTFADTGLATGTSYSYRVRASDAAANLSGYSNTASATTMTSSDTTPPTTPASLTVQCVSYRQCNLAWAASSDNVGVTTYSVEQCSGANCTDFAVAGVVTGAPPATSFINNILSSAVTYSFRVRAEDAAGNFSGYSNVVTGTTGGPGPLQVGNDKIFKTLAAAYAVAGNGDTIEVDYNTSTLGNVTQDIFKCITIRGVGGPPGSQPHFAWDGGNYNNTVANGGTGTNPVPNDKAIFFIHPTCIEPQLVTLDNLEISGAYGVSGNSAAVDYANTTDVLLTNMYIHDNEVGVLGGNSLTDTLVTTIDHSIIARNGAIDGSEHNVYIGEQNHLIFRFNKSVDSRVGHLLKSRARINEIYSNFLSTKDTNIAYEGSLEIDLPCGGDNYIIGNVIEQGINTSNGAIIDVGEEHGPNCGGGYAPTNNFYFINNTVFNYRTTGTFFQVTSAGGPTLTFANQNNILANGGVLYGISTPTVSSNNNTIATASDFVSSATGNYNLVMGASEINAGAAIASVNGVSLTPSTIYVDPASGAARPINSPIDIGAYELPVTPVNQPPRSNRGHMRR